MMKFLKRFLPLLAGFSLLVGTAYGQVQQQQSQPAAADTVSDAELEKFVGVAQELQNIGMDVQQQVQQMVKEEGMEFERFQKIMMSQQNPQMAQNVQMTEQEKKILETIQPKLQQIQQEVQQKQMQVIQNSELSMQRFQEIAQAVQQDPQMMQRFQQMSSDTAGSGNNMN
ncbi:MAG: DUF4168 domain-containing protein [Balneolaceae bacterium]|nr:DUF4168 domain-containing protein [Balneolaceae bacterium]